MNRPRLCARVQRALCSDDQTNTRSVRTLHPTRSISRFDAPNERATRANPPELSDLLDYVGIPVDGDRTLGSKCLQRGNRRFRRVGGFKERYGYN